MIKYKFGIIDIITYLFTGVFLVVTIVPFWQMIIIAFSTPESFVQDPYHIIPRGFSIAVFSELFKSKQVLSGMLISFISVMAGWLGGIFLCSMGAYALKNKKIMGRKLFFSIIIFTMFFNGGIIPMFIWFRKLNINNTIWVLFLPTLINTFYLLLLKNYFTALPNELEEAAMLDGYNEFQILFKIVMPISKPVIAAVSLFLIVQYWNDYFMGMLFIDDVELYPLGLILRNVIINRQMMVQTVIGDQGQLSSQQYNMALVMVSLVPIIILYPFIQQYFVSGIMIGAIKE